LGQRLNNGQRDVGARVNGEVDDVPDVVGRITGRVGDEVGRTHWKRKLPFASVVVWRPPASVTVAPAIGWPVSASVTCPTRSPHVWAWTTIVTVVQPSGPITFVCCICDGSAVVHTWTKPCGTQLKANDPSAAVVVAYGLPFLILFSNADPDRYCFSRNFLSQL
jgi:hypothetical protein